ncbi:hypothetical protein ACHAW5_001192 [Stephanodiscus triporus]|uniref:Endonuclease/exonuclease/phosphatase domain-containing protein n=1 Tax=Stephanodiscus triporus TaxID=2934178 RepID=A0ABD3NI30_9STRA
MMGRNPAAAGRCPAASIPLTLLSWNVSNAQPSSSAPDPAQRARLAPRLIRDECLLLPFPGSSSSSAASSLPDVIALQECPYPTFGREVFGDSGYVSMGTRPSHCGYVDLLVREGLTTMTTRDADDDYDGGDAQRRRRRRRRRGPMTTIIATERHDLPSVAATIELPNGANVAVSSSHLAPFKEGAHERLLQCATLMSLMSERASDCVLLGDFNARAAEDKGMEGLAGGGWVDAWKCGGSNPGDKFTWDSFANRYHGDDGFKFRARFDRCYVRGEALNVTRFGLMGNRRVNGRVGDFLSDHYGLVVDLEVAGNFQEEKEEEEEEREEEGGGKEGAAEGVGKILSGSSRVASKTILSSEELRAKRMAALGRPNAQSDDQKRKRPPCEKEQSSGDNVINLSGNGNDNDI